MTIVDGIAKGHFLRRVAADTSFFGAEEAGTPLGPLDWSLMQARRMEFDRGWTAAAVFFVSLRARPNRKGHFRRNTPTRLSYHSIHLMSIIDQSKMGISPFYTIYPEVICGKSRLEKSLKAW